MGEWGLKGLMVVKGVDNGCEVGYGGWMRSRRVILMGRMRGRGWRLEKMTVRWMS